MGFYVGNTRYKVMVGNNSASFMTSPPSPPDGQLEWVETDGLSYIDTGILAIQPLSIKAKILCVPSTSNQIWCGYRNSSTGTNTNHIVLIWQYTSGKIGVAYIAGTTGGNWGGIDISQSLTNETPLDVKNAVGNGTGKIKISVKQQGDSSYANLTYNTTFNLGYSKNLFLFAANELDTAANFVNQGARLYFSQMFSDNNYTTMVRDYLPWRYNGVVGLWDNVSQTFFAPQGGTLTGGPNVTT